MAMSSATVSPAPDATAHPERGTWVTMTSSGPRLTGAPSTMTEALPPDRRSAASAAASAASMALATGGVPLPKRPPRAR